MPDNKIQFTNELKPKDPPGVKEQELSEYIHPRRPSANENNLTGLGISGGGIRSATFALGVLEGLKENDLLDKKLDYLSTVSGGGYIGSWFSANSLRDINFSKKTTDWQNTIRYLRRYSNYLAPNFSLLSADTWSMITIWFRNTVLIQATLISLIAVVLLLPRVIEPLIGWGAKEGLLLATFVLLAVLVVWIGFNLNFIKTFEDPEKQAKDPKKLSQTERFLIQSSQNNVLIFVGLLLLVSIGFSAILWQITPNEVKSVGYLVSVSKLLPFDSSEFKTVKIFLLVFVVLAFSALSFLSSRAKWYYDVAFALLPTLVFYITLGFVVYLLQSWKVHDYHVCAFTWTPLLVLFSLTLSIIALIGMQGIDSFEYIREWWSRYAAWILILSTAWSAIVVVAFYGPLWLEVLHFKFIEWKISAGSSWLATAWAAISAAGAKLGQSSKTDGKSDNFVSELAAKLSPYVYILGLFALVALGLHIILAELSDGYSFTPEFLLGCINSAVEYPQHWALVDEFETKHWLDIIALFFVILVILIVLSLRIDINEFSQNAFYRNRLARCYMGAARKDSSRHPHPFTGFDPEDDFHISDIAESPSASGPYHLVNCALNLPGSSDLSLHTRHSASFILSPLFCGSNYMVKNPNGEEEGIIGYVPTKSFGRNQGPTLGQAISVSGAAASPNMGYHTSAHVAFLLTSFNIRLGWWFPNPFTSDCKRSSPWFNISPLISELFGVANERDKFLAISDGGHFENLAAYELLRRRCQVVIISDGEADEQLNFEGLANLIRIAQVDQLGLIDIDVTKIHACLTPDAKENISYAVGKITYFNSDGSLGPNPKTGYLIYLKASLNHALKDTALDHYKATHVKFPHESTGDQFYDEPQFESYRRLGRLITEQLINQAKQKIDHHDNLQWLAIAEALYQAKN